MAKRQLTHEERYREAYNNNPRFRKFIDDKALERVNTLMSGAHMLINVAMTMEAETENILAKYGLFVHDIKMRASLLNKDFDKFMSEMEQYYTDKQRRNFTIEFDKMLKDIYVYLGMDEKWEPGQDDNRKFLGFQNAFLHCLNQRGRKTYRYIGRSPDGGLWISAKPTGHGYKLPKGWFPGIKRGEIRKVSIDPLIKF